MRWFKRMIRNWANNDHLNELVPIKGSSRSIDLQGFRLNVFKARGGTVIETNVYDSGKDRNHPGLYVVTDDKDLGEELGKIITMENLRA